MQRQRRGVGVGDEQELDIVDSVRRERHPSTVREKQAALVRSRSDGYLQPGLGHGQPGKFRVDGHAQLSRSRNALRRQLDGVVGELPGEAVVLGGQSFEPAVVIELGEPGPRLLGPGEHPFDVRRVLARQAGERGEALLCRLQPSGVGLDSRGVGAEIGAEVARQVGDLGEALGQGVECRVGTASLVQASPGRGEKRQDIDVVSAIRRRQHRVRALGHALDQIDMSETTDFRLQRRIFAGDGGDRLHLREAKSEQVGFLCPLALTPADLLDLGADAGQRREGLPVALEALSSIGAGEAVERRALHRRTQQAALVSLPVDGHQRLRQLGQQADRHGAAAGEGPGASLRGQRPPEQQCAVIEVAPGVERANDGGVVLGEHEPTVDLRPLVTAAHQRGVAAAAQEQAEPREQHGLAGAGLAGDRGEPRAELEGRVLESRDPALPWENRARRNASFTTDFEYTSG